ncbi:unnamed protein product [Prunus brigantina]
MTYPKFKAIGDVYLPQIVFKAQILSCISISLSQMRKLLCFKVLCWRLFSLGGELRISDQFRRVRYSGSACSASRTRSGSRSFRLYGSMARIATSRDGKNSRGGGSPLGPRMGGKFGAK